VQVNEIWQDVHLRLHMGSDFSTRETWRIQPDFEVLTVVLLKIHTFQNVMLCQVNSCMCLKWLYCLYVHGQAVQEVWFLHFPSLSLDFLNLQTKALQSFETLETIYPVAKHDTPEDLNLLLMINLGKDHVISTGLEVAQNTHLVWVIPVTMLGIESHP